MKKLRIGFSALVAIVAIGLTIAAQAGVFEAKSAKVVTACYDVRNGIPGGIPATVVNTDCEESTILQSIAVCNKTQTLGWQLFTDVSTANQLNEAVVCPGSSTFCCIKYVLDDTPCDEEAQIFDLTDGLGHYKVQAIFCLP